MGLPLRNAEALRWMSQNSEFGLAIPTTSVVGMRNGWASISNRVATGGEAWATSFCVSFKRFLTIFFQRLSCDAIFFGSIVAALWNRIVKRSSIAAAFNLPDGVLLAMARITLREVDCLRVGGDIWPMSAIRAILFRWKRRCMANRLSGLLLGVIGCDSWG
uniref:(northern house mosquito) hypothetical protein n=1 Tax=Culex pipiens TaxID=7175 RepID=A0A8D8H1Y8_CULPI